jgi:small-conductance mechanosensitive channel
MRIVRNRQDGALILLVVLLLAVGYGVYRTGASTQVGPAGVARRAPADRTVTVDQSSLITVEELLRAPTTPEERPFAEDALRIADQESDLAFAQAVRVAAARPRAQTPEVKQIDARLAQAQGALDADKGNVAALTAASAKARAVDAQQIDDRLALAKAMVSLDQDEVDDAQQDLARAGGDPQARMQAMIEQHEAASKSADTVHVTVTPLPNATGVLHQAALLQSLRDKESAIAGAKTSADSLALALRTRHDRAEARRAARLRDSSAAISHDSAAALLAATQQQALTAKTLTTLDHRIDNQHQLAEVYAGWVGAVQSLERVVVNRVLRGLAIILGIVIAGMLLARWSDHTLARLTMDRRRAQTLHMFVRVVLQVIGVLLVLLVIFGPPNNLGTFLGLAGAGLTVALKDFIVGFIGWFVLMGRDGIRIGDLVEINGVTGEVVELGMFQTVLHETADLIGSGNPTGRRVTFTNSFAIEGHYFNFSTSGQWLWDEVQVVVPNGRDPYPIAEALQAEVEEATAESARQAEAEWKGARRSPHFANLAAAPSVNLKPVSGGVELAVRYVTRVSERAEVRERLYRVAVKLLGAVHAGSQGASRISSSSRPIPDSTP